MKSKTKVKLMIVGIVLMVGGTIGFMLYSANLAKRIGETKQRSYVTALIYAGVDFYMQQHQGKWPSSWDELERVNENAAWKQPEIDGEFSRQWVDIDFSYEPQSLVHTAYDDFHAIKPRGEVMVWFLEERYPRLVETAKKYQDVHPADLKADEEVLP